MASLWHLQQKQDRLKRQIAENLELLIGTVSTKGPNRTGHNLTWKDKDQVTRTRHIRKGALAQVRRMIERHRKVKQLLVELSDTNWEILKQETD